MKHEPDDDGAIRANEQGADGRPTTEQGPPEGGQADGRRGLPPVLRVRRQAGRAGNERDAPAFPVHHPYVELLYTSSIGPLGTILLRRLAEAADSGATVATVELAVAAGIRTGTYEEVAGNSPLVKALRRLSRFGLVEWSPDGAFAVTETVGPLPQRQLQRLPERLQQRHAEFLDEANKAA